uniref:EF-hand domain-containing protein n=1 Tax=Paramoeba aestuarina TaxID=180227 RepID=A0A7S4NHX8_9EUKA|mmetsp:Transcript_16454/g.25582  ORF Transcript_16454/g.25582 Transcript_16454/m.25582 type:complete len:149 (+) Transcript_16454:43-489(+)|eukprot:CAMPEP_0201527870 /NCGR_PEP_ID=MMETSP0161_2-20130828/36620_1 /ASSEMBLY_ACC=CAM_ASM_000251 /TAXON_ID=180227 /ORGANISM="Neoparamoeba aestuarina, Strain SoJaBio B1-5/56/2" /LENGTH=148 /DNA_ID=CAMNT_0047928893 /DNA_START=34 /DNA_END=480 /DNA_ORIENTATION=+
MAASEGDLRNSFTLYDQNGDGTIDTACIGECLRVMGFCPTEEEVAYFVQQGGGEGAFVDYNYVKGCTAQCVHVKRNHDELVVAFAGAFDRDNLGYLTTTELRQCLINLGEKLPDEEVDDFLGLAEVDDHGRSTYNIWIKELEGTSSFK